MLGSTTIEVAEACSGIRSLITLLTLATVYGYVMDRRTSVRIALIIGMIPVAIVANGFRVAGTALAAYYYSIKAAEDFFDTFSAGFYSLLRLFCSLSCIAFCFGCFL